MCTLHGWYELEDVIGSGGPGQGPVDYSNMGWWLEYVGGVQISTIDGDPIGMKGSTLTASQTRLPNDLFWTADFNFGFQSCQVNYEGSTYNSDPTISTIPTAGSNYWECKVDFPCEGGL